MIDLKYLNARLKEVYGLTIDGRNRFRVVWSDHETEKRYLEDKVVVLPKYSYLHHRYIFEAYIPTAKLNPEVDSDGYEPIYVFQSNEGDPLDPVWWACEFIVKQYLTSIENARVHKKTLAQMESEEKAKEDKEVEVFKDTLDVSSVDQMKFRYGEAVIHDSSKALKES